MSVTEFPCFSLSRFNREPELTSVEKTALAIWYEKWLIPFSKREELELPFQRLVEPIMAALRHANYHTERELRRALSLILVAVHRWQRTYWVWTDEEWLKAILEIGTEDRIVKQPRNQSVRQLLTCACLLRGPEILFGIPRIAHLQDMAGNILGREAVQEAVTTMQQKGINLGISPKTVHENMPAYLCEALLLCRSAKLSDLTVDVFEKLKAKYSSGSRLMRRSYLPVTRILYNLGSIPYPIEYENLKFKVQHGVDDNLHPDWLAWVDRWFETAVTSRVTRKGQRRQLTKVGRWFTATYPGLTSPTQWNRDIAAAYVATVCEMNVGDWIHPKAHVHLKDKYPKPMEPLSKAALLSAVRVFFGNCQKWGWLPRNFDANSSLELPRSIARLIGPDPRDIPRDHWAKLMNAGLSLTRADIPSADISIRNGYHKETSITWYPFEMVKAIAIV